MSIEDESTLTVSWDFTYSELGEVAKALRWLVGAVHSEDFCWK